MAAMPTSLLLLAVFTPALITLVSSGVPLQRFEALVKQQSDPQLGLYNSSDHVTILTDVNFKQMVLSKNRSSLVEFYNSYCGHCKRFAPKYKELAAQLMPWRDIIPVCAIDCAAEENNDICREYEVMAYPTLRYFGPWYTPSKDNYGFNILSQDIPELREILATSLAAENKTSNMTSWPNLSPLTELEATQPFEGLDSLHEYVVFVYESENSTSTVGLETILHFQRWPNIDVRRINNSDLASKFKIDETNDRISAIDRQGNITPFATNSTLLNETIQSIEYFLESHKFTEKPEIFKPKYTSTNPTVQMEESERNDILNEVLSNKHLIYQADLEMAVRGILNNEVSKVGDMRGERFLALQRLLLVLKRFNPLGPNGRKMVDELHDFVMAKEKRLSGKNFQVKLLRLERKHSPVFSSHHYVGCAGSQPGLRGFTCSLWKLFHFMTVQAANNDVSTDPLEVLQAMHGYVKYFFGCTECSEHFQKMASRRKIWDTPNKDEAVLWLWSAHNEVNQRLAGDATEDSKFPKIQFPSPSSCSQCYKEQANVSPANLDINWNKDAVLSFLKNIYNPEYISRYGVENQDILQPTLEKLRQKRMISNVFSDMDMRMGMLLYGFCIIMMVVAFKLFVFKGYRKKPYGHDMLGKV